MVRKRPHQLRLAHARRPHEQQCRHRPLGVAQAAARARQGGGDGVDGVGLADDALLEGGGLGAGVGLVGRLFGWLV
jgi:hypothetical protein